MKHVAVVPMTAKDVVVLLDDSVEAELKRAALARAQTTTASGVLLDDSVEAELKPRSSESTGGTPAAVLLDDSVEAELKRRQPPDRPLGRGVLLDDSVEAELKPQSAWRSPPGPARFSSTTASRPN